MGFLEDLADGAKDVAGNVVDGAKDVADTVIDTGRDLGAGLVGWETTAQKEAREKMEAATKSGETERAELEARNRGLEAGISEYDPPSISTCENWAAYGHQELFERNKQLDEGRADETATAWIKLAKSLTDLGDRYATELKQKIAGGWEGEAAEAAAASGEPLAKWMKDSAVAFELTGNRIKEAGSAAGQAKVSVPEPEGHNYARTFGTAIAGGPLMAGGDAIAQMKEHQEAERAAQDTMARVLGTTYQNVDGQVPAYRDMGNKPVAPPEPPPPPNIAPPPPPVDPGDRNGGGNVSPAGIDDGGSDNSGGRDLRREHGDRTGPTAPGGDGRLGRGGPKGPAESESAWATDPGVGAPGGGSPSGLGGGGGGVGAMPGGAGAGAGGAGGRAGGGAGSLIAGGRAGTGGFGAGGNAGAGGAAGAAGSRGGAAGGRGAMGVGGMGAGRGQGGDVREHDHPSWLEEQDDIWMDDMPKTAPPVFGE